MRHVGMFAWLFVALWLCGLGCGSNNDNGNSNDAGKDTGAAQDGGADSGADADSDADTDGDTDTDSDSDTDSDTDTDSDSDTDGDGDADADAGDGGPDAGDGGLDGGNVKIKVLLLDDGNSGTQVASALVDAGFVVVQGGNYYDWDASAPSLQGVDTILWLEGYDYCYALLPGTDDAIVAFVQGGGGLVRTEWAAWGIWDGCDPDAGTNDLMPVVYGGDFQYGGTWTLVDAGPLADGLPSTWYDDAGLSHVTLQPNAHKVAVVSGYPGLVFWTEPGGRVVYINHDMSYTTDPMSHEAIQMIKNAVSFSGK